MNDYSIIFAIVGFFLVMALMTIRSSTTERDLQSRLDVCHATVLEYEDIIERLMPKPPISPSP